MVCVIFTGSEGLRIIGEVQARSSSYVFVLMASSCTASLLARVPRHG